MAKYRKYESQMSKHLKFGDFLEDYGKLILNQAATPVETVTGRNFYDPTFKNKSMQDISNIASGISAGATDIAGTVVAGPAYGLAKGATQTAVNVADPTGKLDNTNLENTDELSYRVGQGIGQIGSFGSQFVGSYGQAKPMAQGGKLTEFKTGGTHEENPIGGIPLQGYGASVEEGEVMQHDNNYVVSDRIIIDEDMAKEYSFPKSSIGMSLAAYNKKVNAKTRDNDPYDNETKKRMNQRIMLANEAANMAEFEGSYDSLLKKKMGGKLYKMYTGGQLGDPITGYDYRGRFAKNPIMQFPVEGIPFKNPQIPSVDYTGLPSNNLPAINPLNEESPLTRMTPSGEPITPEFPAPLDPYAGLRRNPNGLPGYKKTNPIGLDSVDTTPIPGRAERIAALEEAERLEALGGTKSGTEGVFTSDVNMNPAYDIMRAAPIVANMLASTKTRRLNKADYRTRARITPGVINIDPLLEENLTDYNQAQGRLKEASSGNAGTYMSNLQSLYGKKAKANSTAYMSKENAETEMDMKAQMTNAEIEARNRQQDFQVDDWNERSWANSRNMLMASASQLGQLGDSLANEAFMEAYVNSISPNYKYNFTRKFRTPKTT